MEKTHKQQAYQELRYHNTGTLLLSYHQIMVMAFNKTSQNFQT